MAGCAMLYNKLNVFFLKKYGGDAAVGCYSVSWETVEGVSTLVSSALLGKVIFPLLAKYWQENKQAFRQLAGQTARSLWAASLPLIFLIFVESDRFLTLIYGKEYLMSVTAQRLLTPCIATAFLHNLAAYAMIGMRQHRLLLVFYVSGLVVNVICCFWLIPIKPLEGAALSLTITKVWVAILTVGFFQWTVHPMSLKQWCILIGTGLFAAGYGGNSSRSDCQGSCGVMRSYSSRSAFLALASAVNFLQGRESGEGRTGHFMRLSHRGEGRRGSSPFFTRVPRESALLPFLL
jgi:O-antigen/teichoic acid export membrane protein